MGTGVFSAWRMKSKIRHALKKLADPVEAAHFLPPGVTIEASHEVISSFGSSASRGNTWSLSVTNRMLLNGIEA